MSRKFDFEDASLHSPIEQSTAITPNDSTDLADPSRAIYADGGGVIRVLLLRDDTTWDVKISAGEIKPLRVRRIYATGTDATGIRSLR